MRNCQVDHNVAWMHHGATDPDNAAVMCGMPTTVSSTGAASAPFVEPTVTWLILDTDNEPVG